MSNITLRSTQTDKITVAGAGDGWRRLAEMIGGELEAHRIEVKTETCTLVIEGIGSDLFITRAGGDD